MAELKYEIVKEFGVLSQSPSGWTKELNLIPGMTVHRNTISANGRLNMPKWAKG